MKPLLNKFKKTIDILETKGIGDVAPLLSEYRLERLFLVKRGNRVEINALRALYPGQGDGTRLLSDLTAVADIKGWTLTLTPDTGLGATSVRRLKRFYKRFGFVENKGKNTDFTISDSMLRLPQNKQ